MVFYGVVLYDVVMFKKGMVIHPQLVETQNSRRDVPIWSHWCLVQGAAHFMWSTQWLHLSQRLLSTCFKETTSVLLPSDCLFLVGNLSPQEGQSGTLQRLKTRSRSKLEILGKTSHANNPTQRSQQEQKVSR